MEKYFEFKKGKIVKCDEFCGLIKTEDGGGIKFMTSNLSLFKRKKSFIGLDVWFSEVDLKDSDFWAQVIVENRD